MDFNEAAKLTTVWVVEFTHLVFPLFVFFVGLSWVLYIVRSFRRCLNDDVSGGYETPDRFVEKHPIKRDPRIQQVIDNGGLKWLGEYPKMETFEERDKRLMAEWDAEYERWERIQLQKVGWQRQDDGSVRRYV